MTEDGLSAGERDARYEAEREQGRRIVTGGLERFWGWSGPAGRLRAARRAQFLIDAARLGPGTRCLELGCGTGEFTRRLVESGCELVAIDVSEHAVARCRKRVGDRADVLVANAETAEGLDGRTFGAIVGVSVLHHLDVELCLENTFALLEHGGRFAFSEPNLLNPQVWAQKRIPAVGRRRHETPHETAFTARGLRQVLERRGLEVDVCEPFDFLHPATPATLVPAVRRLEGALERTPLRAIAGSVRVAGRRP